MKTLELHCADLQLGVLPELGGALAWLRHGEVDLLRPWDGSPTVRRSACYPLVPYSNRIADGCFQVEGVAHELPRNFGEHPHSIHGLGWQREWQVVEQSASECLLRLAHDPGGRGGADWPFAFEVEQRLSLDADGLSLSLGLRNDSQQQMPAGLGWHPYFPRQDGIELEFEAAAVWLNGEDSLPCEQVEVPPTWRFNQRRSLGYVGLDNCFEGWTRRASLYWPSSGLSVQLDAEPGLDYLVVFTPPAPLDFIAVEPVSHLNNAINTFSPEANGLLWLQPGQTVQCRLRINVAAGATGETE